MVEDRKIEVHNLSKSFWSAGKVIDGHEGEYALVGRDSSGKLNIYFMFDYRDILQRGYEIYGLDLPFCIVHVTRQPLSLSRYLEF